MRLKDDPAETDFREQTRTWLEEHAPRETPPPHGPERRAFDMAWQRAQWEGGYAGVGWPARFGGGGFDLLRQLVWFEEYARSGAPDIGCAFVGLNHAGPTLIDRATDEQRAAHLPAILRGDSVWCQGFSEPGAGSDLAGLTTRGRVEGDAVVVNGQKIWSSFADVADQQELLVRTDPDSLRHRGLTWLMCDMSTSGIEVRPIRTMVGTPEFCEVYYDDVRVPLSNVVGDVGAGWSVALSTLSFERGTGFVREQVQLLGEVDQLVDLARARCDGRGRPLLDDDAFAADLARARAEAAAMYSMTMAVISQANDGGSPGAEGSMVRLYHSELRQRFERLRSRILGVEGLLIRGTDPDPSPAASYLDSFKVTIGGGTKEVQRNIIGERVLGLPR